MGLGESTYNRTLQPGQCAFLNFDADVDSALCALRIAYTPDLTYTVTVPGYETRTRTLWHNNGIV